MRVRLLGSARDDLASGRAFYEKQGQGLGDYFLDSVFADIDSLAPYGGILASLTGLEVGDTTGLETCATIAVT